MADLFCSRLVGFLITVVACFLGNAVGQDVMLDFSQQATLKGVFDTGLRPYRSPHGERFQVHSEKVRAGVVFPGGFVIQPYDWEGIDFNVINDGRISAMNMRTGPLTIEEAEAAMIPFAEAQGEPLQTMKDFLERARAKPFFYEGEYHVGTGKSANPSRVAAFRRTGFKEKPLAVEVILEWRFEPGSAARAFYKEPIPPPPGYENVSMGKPPYPGSVAGTVPLTTPAPADAAPTPTLFAFDESKHASWYAYPNVFPILESNLGILKDFDKKGIPSPESSFDDFYLLVWLRTLTAYDALLKYRAGLSPEKLKKQNLVPGSSDAESIKKLLSETRACLDLKRLSGEKITELISLIKSGDIEASYKFLSFTHQ